MAKRKKLTEEDWQAVFAARCRSKRGERLSPDDRALVDAAYEEDRERYKAMEGRVFNATVPFGSMKRVPE